MHTLGKHFLSLKTQVKPRSKSLTYTAHPGGVEFKVCRAVTVVASRDVDTHPINTDGRVCTFIDIWGKKKNAFFTFFLNKSFFSTTVWRRRVTFPEGNEVCSSLPCYSSIIFTLFEISIAHLGINRASLRHAAGLVCVLVLPVQLPPLLSSS